MEYELLTVGRNIFLELSLRNKRRPEQDHEVLLKSGSTSLVIKGMWVVVVGGGGLPQPTHLTVTFV